MLNAKYQKTCWNEVFLRCPKFGVVAGHSAGIRMKNLLLCCSGSVVSEIFLRKFDCKARMIAYNLGLIYSIQYYRYSSRNMKKLNIAIYMFLHTCITLYSPITYSTQTTILPPLSVYALRVILVNVCFHHAFTIHVLRLHFPMNTVS